MNYLFCFYKYKIVTLDGQLLNPGGSLTGGSLIKNAGLLSRKEDIKRINDQIAKLNDKQTRLTAEYDLAVEEVNKIANNYIKKIEEKHNTTIVSWTTLSP